MEKTNHKAEWWKSLSYFFPRQSTARDLESGRNPPPLSFLDLSTEEHTPAKKPQWKDTVS